MEGKLLNRKAQVEDWLPLLVLIVLAAFALIFFMKIGPMGKAPGEKEAQTLMDKVNGDYNLIQFLKRPVTNQHAATVSELIVYSYLNGDYSELRDETKAFFSSIYGDGWRVDIYNQHGGLIIPITPGKDLARKKVSEAAIPLPENDKNDYLKVVLLKTQKL